nr:MAG TPA: hypothetical protein [Caudoviricetes sp.]
MLVWSDCAHLTPCVDFSVCSITYNRRIAAGIMPGLSRRCAGV